MANKVHPLTASGWLVGVSYGAGTLSLLTDKGRVIVHYNVPAWRMALLIATDRRAALGHKVSTGRAYNQLIKGSCPSVSSTVPEYAAQLAEVALAMTATLAKAAAEVPPVPLIPVSPLEATAPTQTGGAA